MLMGIVLPGLWGLLFAGKLTMPGTIVLMQWHAHEMLFGFGGAVLFGFLLTASKNWVNVRGIHGTGLMIFVGIWIFERFFFYWSSGVEPVFRHIGFSLFVAACGSYIAWTLIKFRKSDSFKDNYFFLLLLALIVLAKNLLVSDLYYQHGIAMTIGLFRLAFAVMFERTMTQFVKSTEGVTLYRNFLLDLSIKVMVALSVFQSFLPNAVSVVLLFGAAGGLLIRWLIWRPDIGFRKFGNATMYMGYFALILHFIFEALKISGVWSHGTFSTHVFTFLCMGIVIPSMLVRISKGHTGRKPEFQTAERSVIFLIFISAIFRLVFPLIFPNNYSNWIMVAGLLWSVAFLILAARLGPLLLRARVDGKIH